jgi:osmotically-inducible protein OsmY
MRLLLLSLLLAVGVGGCEREPPPAAAPAPVPMPMSDADLHAAVSRQLQQDPTVAALRLQIDVAGARVRLQGAAPDTATRRRIAEQVQAVPGVQAVDNQLSVQLPAIPPR